MHDFRSFLSAPSLMVHYATLSHLLISWLFGVKGTFDFNFFLFSVNLRMTAPTLVILILTWGKKHFVFC